MSDARMSHLMAGDHGWIDLTVKALSQPKDKFTANECTVMLVVNGESVLRESANFAVADAKGNSIGYRFPAPSGQLDVEFTYLSCVKEPFSIKQSLSLAKDHLAKVVFDGSNLVVSDSSAYKPTSLEAVGAEMKTMRDGVSETEKKLSNNRELILLCLGLNFLILVLLLWRRRRG